MGADMPAREDWIRRVLGVELSKGRLGAAAPVRAARNVPAKPRAPLMPIWVKAKEEVDVGIGRLQNVLRGFDDGDLNAITEFGLYGVTDRANVRLMTALTEADLGASPEALRRVVDAVGEFRAFLDVAPIVELLENNPFGVQVPMRRTLEAALAELERRAAS
jgi:hypothetical protein